MNINSMTECLRLFEISGGSTQEVLVVTQEMKESDLKKFKNVIQSIDGTFHKRVE